MVDGTSGARLRVRIRGEDKPGTAEYKPVRTLREPARPEVLLIPGGGCCRVQHVQMDMVVRQRLGGSGGVRYPDGEAQESSRKYNSLHEESFSLRQRCGTESRSTLET